MYGLVVIVSYNSVSHYRLDRGVVIKSFFILNGFTLWITTQFSLKNSWGQMLNLTGSDEGVQKTFSLKSHVVPQYCWFGRIRKLNEYYL